jgi:Xaa-Pro aminopeptidase
MIFEKNTIFMDRIADIREVLNKHKAESFLVTNLTGIKYLSGFMGSAGVIFITQKKAYFITDFRYKTVVKDVVSGSFDVEISKQGSYDFLKKIVKKEKIKSVGFEAGTMNYAAYESLKEMLNVKLIPINGLVEKITAVKTANELDCIKKAVEITDNAFGHILGTIRPGRTTETELAADITYIQMKLGGERNAFDPIVASGPNSALPHAHPTNRVIQHGDMLTLDYGTVYKGFNSDMTRTVAVGNISDELRNIYNIVLDAQLKALDLIKKGASCKKVDSAARSYIKENGYGDNFGHGLGHGLGYDVHESPRFNQFSKDKLEVNNVMTVEPGIYIEGLGGVRIEDDVIITENGCEILNRSPKELIVL